MVILVFLFYVRWVSQADVPKPADTSFLTWTRHTLKDSVYVVNNNWFKLTSSGLYEMYVEGNAFERGVANGKLSAELIQYQEKVFNDQVNKLVPSSIYREFLKYFVGWFNRHLDEDVQEEYRLEIYGLSQSFSHDYDAIAPPYQRVLNYHAAHDIGHALQNMSLVGCTSFATWDDRSEDSTLIIGRNFDFYVGEEFARYKIVSFVHPDKGYDFAMITFPGMIGVLSGMNQKGLTVTINAAKSEIPSSSATPVSLVAREVLQYASSVDEAHAIIKERKMFVSESFLIGSANDRQVAVIEKTPRLTEIYYPGENYVICTNHFQSAGLGKTELNLEHIKTSASPYRYKRVEELLSTSTKNSVPKTAYLLRNKQGLDNDDIGLGNEKAINQLISHHAVIFQPEKQLMWVSTAPWQLGELVCYDLSKGIKGLKSNHDLRKSNLDIEPDTFLNSHEYKNFVKFSQFRFPFSPRVNMNPDSIVKWNPNSYLSYMLAGDAYFERRDYSRAIVSYKHALGMEIATEAERRHMEKFLSRSEEELK